MFQPLPVEQVEADVLERSGDGDVVLIERGDEPIVQTWHRDFARVQCVEKMAARPAALVELERVAVGFILHDDPAAAVAEGVG